MTETEDQNLMSPVAKHFKRKNMAWHLLIGIALVVVLFAMLKPHHVAKAAPPPEVDTVTPITEQPPQLTLSQQEIDKLKTAMQSWHQNENNQAQQESDKLYKMRLIAPVLVYSGNNSNLTTAANTSNNVLDGSNPQDANSQFMQNVSHTSVSTAEATRIAHPDTTLTQGTMIWATLETRIISDLPGMVRAVTSADIYSDDGSQILIPKGSRLIGQYSSGIAQGQNRIFVVWQRLIRPDHIDIQLNSPGTDTLGTAGIGADGVDYHFFQQFGTAALLSLIGAGAANVGVNPNDDYNSQASYRAAVAESFSQSAQDSLQSTGAIKPTVYINQGDKISVFVARDLDFHDVLANPEAM